MDIDLRLKDFRAGTHAKLKNFPTDIKPLYKTEEEYEKLLAQFRRELYDRQEILYAQGHWSVLVLFQGMDTAGKDGAIAHVMSGLNPQGVSVSSFKQPSDEELAHDYMWRAYRALPRRGSIGIFNRSYYEEVLITRVHASLLSAERVPKELLEGSDKHGFWKQRFKDICHHEAYWSRNGTRVVKFFLHLSKKEQLKRLTDRLAEKDKHWKVSESDFHERGFWKEYQEAYEDFLRHTSHDEAPWYIVPADDKKNARLIVGNILVETFKKLPLNYPEPTSAQEKFIREMKKELRN